MRVHIRYFASIREALGSEEFMETSAETVGDLRTHLLTLSPAHAELLARGKAVRMALNQTLCDEATPLIDGAEVAFFPPVTGG